MSIWKLREYYNYRHSLAVMRKERFERGSEEKNEGERKK